MNDSNYIFLHKVLKAIADSIIKIFIPLYILKVTNELWLAITYVIAQSFLTSITMIILKKVLQKHGLACIIIHCFFIIATQAIFSFFNINIYVVLICALLMAFAQTLYSIPLNILFTKADKTINVAKFQIATNVGKLCFMLFSGIILSKIPDSFLYLSIIATVFYLLSILPICLAYKDLKQTFRAKKIKDNSDNAPTKTTKWFNVFHYSFGLFQIIIEVVVPLYLYINNLSFEAVTTIIALIELLKILSNILAKWLVKKNYYIFSFIASTTIFVLCLFGIILFKNAVVLYILSCLISVSFPLCFVPMFNLFCNNINKNNNLEEQMTRRDFDIFAPRPILYSTYFLGFSLLPCLCFGFVSATALLLSEIKAFKKTN